MTPERKVKESLINYLSSLKKSGVKIYYEAREAGGFAYRKGLPDLWYIYNGHHVEIEVKAKGGQLSTMQLKWQEWFAKMNVECYCISSLDELRELIERQGPIT